jgi:hypothetical protein
LRIKSLKGVRKLKSRVKSEVVPMVLVQTAAISELEGFYLPADIDNYHACSSFFQEE